MARKPRIPLAGYTQHLIQRGNNRAPCFFADSDYPFYLAQLKDAADKHLCHVHAYVLMTNHIHLLTTPQQDHAVTGMMKQLSQNYTQYVNFKYQRSGSVWDGRYKASVIDSERYLLACYRYIELNPVRAKMVNKPSDYPWSSARCHGLGDVNDLITDHECYLALASTPEERQRNYRKLFQTMAETELDFTKLFEQENILGDKPFIQQLHSALQASGVRP
jgi:putative transposase